jgi:hypothetical protein
MNRKGKGPRNERKAKASLKQKGYGVINNCNISSKWNFGTIGRDIYNISF